MSEKRYIVQISLTESEKELFNKATGLSEYNKQAFAKKALLRDVSAQIKKSRMHNPNDIRDGMMEDK